MTIQFFLFKQVKCFSCYQMTKYYVGILPTWLVVQIYLNPKSQQPATPQGVPTLTDIWEKTKKPQSSSRWANHSVIGASPLGNQQSFRQNLQAHLCCV